MIKIEVLSKHLLGAVIQHLIDRDTDDFQVQTNGATGGYTITTDPVTAHGVKQEFGDNVRTNMPADAL